MAGSSTQPTDISRPMPGCRFQEKRPGPCTRKPHGHERTGRRDTTRCQVFTKQRTVILGLGRRRFQLDQFPIKIQFLCHHHRETGVCTVTKFSMIHQDSDGIIRCQPDKGIGHQSLNLPPGTRHRRRRQLNANQEKACADSGLLEENATLHHHFVPCHDSRSPFILAAARLIASRIRW